MGRHRLPFLLIGQTLSLAGAKEFSVKYQVHKVCETTANMAPAHGVTDLGVVEAERPMDAVIKVSKFKDYLDIEQIAEGLWYVYEPYDAAWFVREVS